MSIVKIIGKTILLLVCCVIQTLGVLFSGLSMLFGKFVEYLYKLCDKLEEVAKTGMFKKKTSKIDVPL